MVAKTQVDPANLMELAAGPTLKGSAGKEGESVAAHMLPGANELTSREAWRQDVIRLHRGDGSVGVWCMERHLTDQSDSWGAPATSRELV